MWEHTHTHTHTERHMPTSYTMGCSPHISLDVSRASRIFPLLHMRARKGEGEEIPFSSPSPFRARMCNPGKIRLARETTLICVNLKQGKAESGQRYMSPPSSFLLPPTLSLCVLQSLSVSTLRQGPQTFPDDPTHPLPPLILGCSHDRARLALESVAKVELIYLDIKTPTLFMLLYMYIPQGITILGDSLFGPSSPSPEVPLAYICGGHLLQKAGSAYLFLAVSFTKSCKYGRALRYARYALLCFRTY